MEAQKQALSNHVLSKIFNSVYHPVAPKMYPAFQGTTVSPIADYLTDPGNRCIIISFQSLFESRSEQQASKSTYRYFLSTRKFVTFFRQLY